DRPRQGPGARDGHRRTAPRGGAEEDRCLAHVSEASLAEEASERRAGQCNDTRTSAARAGSCGQRRQPFAEPGSAGLERRAVIGVRLYSTLQRDRVELPEPPGPIRMYFCGPTVYARAHIGNARPFVLGMWLRNWLRERGY